MKHTPTPWRPGKGYGAVVADSPVQAGPQGADDVEFYGGHLICESASPGNIAFICLSANYHRDLAEALIGCVSILKEYEADDVRCFSVRTYADDLLARLKVDAAKAEQA